MKKITFIKKTLLACSLFAVVGSGASLLAQEVNLNDLTEVTSRVPDNHTIQLTITPMGTTAIPNEITVKEGESFEIHGNVILDNIIPNVTYKFSNIEVVTKDGDYHFLPLLSLQNKGKQTSSDFTYHYKASWAGNQTLAFNVKWTKDGSSKEDKEVCPITVKVIKK